MNKRKVDLKSNIGHSSCCCSNVNIHRCWIGGLDLCLLISSQFINFFFWIFLQGNNKHSIMSLMTRFILPLLRAVVSVLSECVCGQTRVDV
ncbi:hypothetical protein CROQUDRAFT_207484 [Cronartium quercuum f. sp. fusiforme G11]|uniref:Uncharacterized protein n=1 Tax=Cronartium quercuum f. sp. fusiforme G11 TaxID=708437 RepID=A0A9P6NFA5_9BASI|nr:hypothetical protein CROQUDRAFT_207484 [Cronartium quercuum f. sp. fusiforme G11]